MANLSAEAKNSVNILRALLNTKKGATSISFLLREYREVEGINLPYKRYGFNKAEDFLNSTDEFILVNLKGEMQVSARPNKSSAHIVNMVKKQKEPKKLHPRIPIMSSRTRSTRNTPKSYNALTTSKFSHMKRETQDKINDPENTYVKNLKEKLNIGTLSNIKVSKSKSIQSMERYPDYKERNTIINQSESEKRTQSNPVSKQSGKLFIKRQTTLHRENKQNQEQNNALKLVPPKLANIPDAKDDETNKRRSVQDRLVLKKTNESSSPIRHHTILLPIMNPPLKTNNGFNFDDIIHIIELPWHKNFWVLYITYCESAEKIYARIMDENYSDKFESLLNEITSVMSINKIRPSSLIINQIYLVYSLDCWHRVRMFKIDKANGKCLCNFIDFGDTQWLSMSELYICDRNFLKLPAQSIQFSLLGLEDYVEKHITQQYLSQMLLEKVLIAKIITKKEIYENESLDDRNKSIKILLIEKSKEKEIVLNNVLFEKIYDNIPVPDTF